jgi:hypothetical protein
MNSCDYPLQFIEWVWLITKWVWLEMNSAAHLEREFHEVIRGRRWDRARFDVFEDDLLTVLRSIELLANCILE